MIDPKPATGIEVQIPNTGAFLDELRAGRGPNVDNVIRVARTSHPTYLNSDGRKIPSPVWDVYAEATYLRFVNGVCLLVHLREFVGQEWITSDGPIMDERHQQVKERVQRSLSAIEDFCRGHNSDWIVVDGSQYGVVSSKP
jgi:hypothetical protein